MWPDGDTLAVSEPPLPCNFRLPWTPVKCPGFAVDQESLEREDLIIRQMLIQRLLCAGTGPVLAAVSTGNNSEEWGSQEQGCGCHSQSKGHQPSSARVFSGHRWCRPSPPCSCLPTCNYFVHLFTPCLWDHNLSCSSSSRGYVPDIQ